MELEDSQHSEFASDARRVAPFIGALLLAAAGIVFALREHNNAQTAAAQRQTLVEENKQMTARLNETQDQLATLSAKVSSLTAPAPQTPASSPTAASSGRRPAPGRTTDPRFKRLQSQLDAQGKLSSPNAETSIARAPTSPARALSSPARSRALTTNSSSSRKKVSSTTLSSISQSQGISSTRVRSASASKKLTASTALPISRSSSTTAT